ncbi:hypothetical protein HPK19_19320 [Arthrobacter citreus]|nr:hypothetical protein HPK19_19320 [Arthrobacter citreus]
MKRQHSPAQKAKREVRHFKNIAQKSLAIGKWWEQKHFHVQEESNHWKERFNDKNQEHEALYSQFHGLRNEYFERNDELSNAKQEILHYQKRIEEQMIRFNKNESELIKEVINLENIIVLKDKQLLAVSIWFAIYVVFDIVGYFI